MKLVEGLERLLVLFEAVLYGGLVEVDGNELEGDLFDDQDDAGGKEGADDHEDGAEVGGAGGRGVLNGQHAAETDPGPGDAKDELEVEDGGHESLDVSFYDLGRLSVDGDDDAKCDRGDPIYDEKGAAACGPDDGDPNAPDDDLGSSGRLRVGGGDDDERDEADCGSEECGEEDADGTCEAETGKVHLSASLCTRDLGAFAGLIVVVVVAGCVPVEVLRVVG